MSNYCPVCLTYPCICEHLRPETTTHPLGGQRDNEHIPNYSLIPRRPLIRVADRLEHGTIKYSRNNWRNGLSASNCIDRAIEHIYKHIEGDNSEDNLSAAVVNLLFVMEYEVTHPELIDYRLEVANE